MSFETEHLDAEQRRIADAIKSVLPADASDGGCRAFYTPAEWVERGEEYGTDSVLVLVHDGGALAPFCSYDYGDYKAIDRLDKALSKIGYYAEQCTSWYSAVYSTRK